MVNVLFEMDWKPTEGADDLIIAMGSGVRITDFEAFAKFYYLQYSIDLFAMGSEFPMTYPQKPDTIVKDDIEYFHFEVENQARFIYLNEDWEFVVDENHAAEKTSIRSNFESNNPAVSSDVLFEYETVEGEIIPFINENNDVTYSKIHVYLTRDQLNELEKSIIEEHHSGYPNYLSTARRFICVDTELKNWFDSLNVNDSYQFYYDFNVTTARISFDSNGGSAVAPYENVEIDIKIDSPTVPVYEGYRFDGWYLSYDTTPESDWLFSQKNRREKWDPLCEMGW